MTESVRMELHLSPALASMIEESARLDEQPVEDWMIEALRSHLEWFANPQEGPVSFTRDDIRRVFDQRLKPRGEV